MTIENAEQARELAKSNIDYKKYLADVLERIEAEANAGEFSLQLTLPVFITGVTPTPLWERIGNELRRRGFSTGRPGSHSHTLAYHVSVSWR
jgi:hypothetical protein